jgi:xylulose-5-phosphate/fructose-6-phosphate phosphoketolase
MIVLESPKGWTGPKTIDGLPTEGNWRSHQVPFGDVATNPARLAELERWLHSYRPEELFTPEGRPVDALLALAPRPGRRLGLVAQGNGGQLRRPLRLPDWRSLAIAVDAPGDALASATGALGRLLRDVFRLNAESRNFLLFGPDETASNRLGAVFEATSRRWLEAWQRGALRALAAGLVSSRAL